MSTPPVHAVVVAYHHADQLDRCLAALEGAVPVTVVDNSSAAEIREVADRHGTTYIDPGRNLGFAAGVNEALRALLTGTPTDVLLLNPDSLLKPDAFHALAEDMRKTGNDKVAAIAPRLVSLDEADQRVAWPFPTPWRAWLEAFGLGRLPARRTFVVGAVLLLRWEALVEVGLLDERFFLYAEEADWQRRAAALGWTSAVCLRGDAQHEGSGTSPDPLGREALFHAGQETYVRKWFGPLGWSAYRMAVLLGAIARALVLSGERRSEAARRARLYARGPRRCVSALN